MKTVWFLTPLNNPSRRIAGPYEHRKSAVRESILRLSDEARYSAAWNARLPNLLVPTPARVQDVTQVETISVLANPVKTQAVVMLTTQKYKRKLDSSIYTLPIAALFYLCDQLELPVSSDLDKEGLVKAIEDAINE